MFLLIFSRCNASTIYIKALICPNVDFFTTVRRITQTVFAFSISNVSFARVSLGVPSTGELPTAQTDLSSLLRSLVRSL